MSLRRRFTYSPISITIWVRKIVPLCVFIIACERCFCPYMKGLEWVTCPASWARSVMFHQRCSLICHFAIDLLSLFVWVGRCLPLLGQIPTRCPLFSRSLKTLPRLSCVSMCILICLAFFDLKIMIFDYFGELVNHIVFFFVFVYHSNQTGPLFCMIVKRVPSSALIPLRMSFLALLNSLLSTISLNLIYSPNCSTFLSMATL